MSKVYTLCSCGHSDDDHQSLRQDFVPVEGQKVCYGKNCECTGYLAVALVRNYRIIKDEGGVIPGIERLHREGRYYKWV